MKTVMKKLLSLALVAILLVSAVPFQASATTDGEGAEPKSVTVPIDLYIDGDFFDNWRTLIVTEGSTVKLDEATGLSKLNNPGNYTFDHWESSTTAGDVTGNNLGYDWASKEGYSLRLYIKTKDIPHTHEYNLVNEVAATCTTDGSKTYTCKNTDGKCDKVTKIETIPATGHDFGDWSESDGKYVHTCKNCTATESKSVITFVADDKTVDKKYLNKGDSVGTLPTAPDKLGYHFEGWYTGKYAAGDQLETDDKWNGDYTTYYAYYSEDPTGTKDNMSYLTVRMKLYTGSTLTNDEVILKEKLSDSTKILSWLQKNQSTIIDAVYAKVDSTKYQWIDRVYYDNDANGELTSQATLADGDKVVYIKVHAVASTETNVQLYIHQYNSTSKTYSTLKIVDVGGYKAGDTITLSKMASIVKKSYSYTSIKGLYTNDAWSQLVNGQNPTASTSLTVESGKTVKYHVILNGATTASSSNADKTNPKTGDMIVVPMMIMVASAAAVAYVYFGSKKRSAR